MDTIKPPQFRTCVHCGAGIADGSKHTCTVLNTAKKRKRLQTEATRLINAAVTGSNKNKNKRRYRVR